jgi:hypothetical protein
MVVPPQTSVSTLSGIASGNEAVGVMPKSARPLPSFFIQVKCATNSNTASAHLATYFESHSP